MAIEFVIRKDDSRWNSLSARERFIHNMRVYLSCYKTFNTTKGYKDWTGWHTVTDLLFEGRPDGGFNIYKYSEDGKSRRQIPLSRISEADCAIIDEFLRRSV